MQSKTAKIKLIQLFFRFLKKNLAIINIPFVAIINIPSVSVYTGIGHLLDNSVIIEAIVTFTRSLSANLVKRGICVNVAAPGPIWTPFIPASFPPKDVAAFGIDVPLGRAGQPEDAAPCCVLFASDDSSYMTGQILHPNGFQALHLNIN